MDYKHEIFISYKWSEAKKEWVNKIFKPLLTEALNDVLDTKPEIFRDLDSIVFGAQLDKALQEGVAHSKCMICIISPPYFTQSVWCPTEFSAMLYREQKTNIRDTSANSTGFIFPVIFVDETETKPENRFQLYKHEVYKKLIGNFMPLELDDQKYNNTNTAFIESSDYNNLRSIIRKWVTKSLKPAIENVPAWKPEWESDEYINQPYIKFQADYSIAKKPMAAPSLI